MIGHAEEGNYQVPSRRSAPRGAAIFRTMCETVPVTAQRLCCSGRGCGSGRASPEHGHVRSGVSHGGPTASSGQGQTTDRVPGRGTWRISRSRALLSAHSGACARALMRRVPDQTQVSALLVTSPATIAWLRTTPRCASRRPQQRASCAPCGRCDGALPRLPGDLRQRGDAGDGPVRRVSATVRVSAP